MGGGLLILQTGSLFQLLSSIYPEFKWEPKLFSQQESGIWNNESLSKVFVEWLKKQTKQEVSYTNHLIKDMKIGSNLLTQLLTATFPQFKWIISVTSPSSKKSQYMLKECIVKLFSDDKKEPVLLEEYKHPDIANIELDYFLPQYNIAFEYQVMKESCL